MPSPMETLLRTQLSPVPVHTVFEFVGSMATAPIDCTAGLSNTGLKVAPPLTDFHTPPLAEAANRVRRPASSTAATAAMRPLICAEPMLRAGRPEIAPASNLTGPGGRVGAGEVSGAVRPAGGCGRGGAPGAGILKSAALSGTLASMLSTVIFDRSPGFAVFPLSMEKGK